MSHGLGRDGWPSDTTVIRGRDAEIERLRAEVEALRKKAALPMKYRRMEFNAQLQTENEALRKDAERYAYLRSRNRDSVLYKRYTEAGVWCDCENADGDLTLLTGDDLDAAVDTAMAKEKL